ncbi:phosphoethanolamine transferase CptA [Azospira restricta]|uniref:Phosphoethanolamine transferase CptA n=2 Tax=Azospira restricta TaxID=404405 RepID=A0A974SSK8_9RHOO|nr:phosphoethanolamine transferase CptA [Azospira restricta]
MAQTARRARTEDRIDWRALARAYLFFWYFSGVSHLLLLASGATGFFPFRQGLLVSALWLVPLLLLPRHGRRIAALVGAVLWACSLVNLGYFAIYGQEFSQSALYIVFESNPAEAGEYLGNYFAWWMPPAALAYTAGAVWLWRGLRPLAMPRRQAWAIVALVLLVVFLPATLKTARKRSLLSEAWAESVMNRLEPAVPWQFAFGLVRYEEQLAQMQSLLEKNKSLPPLAKLVDANGGLPATLVLVIGESTNRQHMGLYGYARDTSPQLQALHGQLTAFDNVIASRPYTIETLQQALTFADQENPDLHLSRPSLMNLMKQAGYKTYWITNQQTLSKRNTMLTNFSEQTDEQVYLNHTRSQNSYQFDGNVLTPFARILGDAAERRFIVVHLLGTHMRYEYRYPPEFEHFKDASGLPGWVGDKHLAMINHYDNAVRYNDFVVASLVERLAAAGGRSLMLYFADHGEDVYDTPPHDFIGRNEASPTPAMYTVPFLLWRSPEWQAAHPRSFAGQTGRLYQTAHLIHTWADLAGLSFDGYDPTKSVVNERFKERPLWVGAPGSAKGLVDLRPMLAGGGRGR